jgi:hypothetical protein
MHRKRYGIADNTQIALNIFMSARQIYARLPDGGGSPFQ